MKFKNKVVIVTGGARDIGKAISLKFAAEGANVIVNYYNNSAQAEATLAEIEAAGGNAIIVKGDMTEQADVNNLLDAARKQYGDSIDYLVNVVGGLVARKPLAEMDADFMDLVLRLNVTSTFMMTQAVVPFMSEGSSIINLASQAGRDGGGPGAAAYAASKGAVMSFTRSMAKELGPKGIRVNALCPGMISTTFHDTFTKDEVRTNVANATPLKREGRATEIADTVAFLASSESGFMTGVNLDINGGLFYS